MKALNRMFTRWHRRERELAAELESHLEMHAADNLRAGMTPDEALRRARIALGGIEQTKEHYRDRRRFRLLADLGRDVLFASRVLVRHRSFTTTAVVVLGVGLALTNTFYVMTSAIALRGLPIDEPHRVMMVRGRDSSDRILGASYPDFRDIRAAARSFTGIGAYAPAAMAVGDDRHAAERFDGAYISSEVFALIGERPIAGRDFRPEDDVPGAPPVVILGRSVWTSRYGANPAVVGSTLRVNGTPATVVGIVPDRSKFMTNAEVWQPLARLPGIAEQSRGSRALMMFGRLKPGASWADGTGELNAIWRELARQYPATNADARLAVMPINDNFIGDTLHPAWYAFNAAGLLVLVVACANVANLLVMRGANRAREMAMRASLGATRARLFRQLLAESAAIATGGGILGVVLSMLALQLLWLGTPAGMLPHWMAFRIDPPVLALIAATCLVSAVLIGTVPAIRTSRGNLTLALNSGARGAGGDYPSRRLTSALVVFQFATALGSLVAITVAARSVAESNGIPEDTGQMLLTMSISPGERYATAEARAALFERVRERFQQVEGVASVALATNLPLGGTATRGLVTEERDQTSGGARPMVRSVTVSPGYFATLGVPLIRGRELDDRDSLADPMPVVVNQRFVELHANDGDPIGRPVTLIIDSKPRTFAVVGVSPGIRQRTIPGGQASDAIVYLPMRGVPPLQMAIIVRPVAAGVVTAAALRDAMASLDRDIPLYRVMTLAESIDESDWNGRVSSVIANFTAMLTVLLAAVGVFAVTMHAMTLMTPEIGVRMALGARPRHVLGRVLRSAAVQLGLGIVAGIAFALVWDRFFGEASSPTGVGPIDFVVAAVLLALVASVACLVPALRALRVNPLVALRE